MSGRKWDFRAARTARGGFTLIEVLLVLIILVILAGMAVPLITNAQKNANQDAAKSQAGLFSTPLDQFHLDMNRYPSSDEGLNALVTAPSSAGTKWKGPYIDRIPNDPWGNPFQYAQPGEHNTNRFDVWSNGPDGQPKTQDDVGNWES